MTHRPILFAASTFAICAMISACGNATTTNGTDGPPMSSEHSAQIDHDLQTLPSLEAAQSQYRTLVTTMADAITALTPGTTWRFDDTSWIGCAGEYVDTDAKQAYVSAVFSGPIPDARWPAALRIVADGAARLGATQSGTYKDGPGDHDAYVTGPGGVEFRLGTQVAATLSAKSDCRLAEADSTSTTSTPSG